MARLVQESGVLGEAAADLTAKNLDEKVSFAQMVDAIHVVQTNLGITGTTAKEAGETIQGSVNSMKASWNNLKTGLANSNRDMQPLFDEFAESAKTALNNIIPAVKNTLLQLPKAIGGLVDIMDDNFDDLFGGLIDSAVEVIGELAVKLPSLFQKVFAKLPSILNNIFKKLGIEVDFTPLFKGIESVAQGLGKTLHPAVKTIIDIFNLALKVIEPVGNLLQKIGENQKLLDLIRNLAVAFAALKVVTGIITPIVTAFKTLQTVITAAREAQTLYNAVLAITEGLFNTNPIMLAVTALTILGTTIFTLVSNTNDANNSAENFTRTIYDERDAYQRLAEAIDAEKGALDRAKNLKDDLFNKQKEYTTEVEKTREAQDKLNKLEAETGESGVALYEKVGNNAEAYKNLSEEQRKVYQAYLDLQIQQTSEGDKLNELKEKQQEVANVEQILVEREKERATQEANLLLQQDINLARTSGNYDAFKEHLIQSYTDGTISAQNAALLIKQATQDMDAQSAITFVQDIPASIGTTNEAYADSSVKASELQSAIDTSFGNVDSKSNEVFGTNVPNAISGSLDKSNYEGQANGLEQMFKNTADAISKIIDGIKNAAKAAGDWIANWMWNTSSSVQTPSNQVQNSINSQRQQVAGIGFSSQSFSATSNGGNSINGRKLVGNGNLPTGFIQINIDGAKYSNEENLAKAISYELQKELRKGRAMWA